MYLNFKKDNLLEKRTFDFEKAMMEFLKRAFAARTSSSALSPNQTHPSPASDSQEKCENLIVQIFPGDNGRLAPAGMLPSCVNSVASPVSSDSSQMTPVSSDQSQTTQDTLDCDRGLVLHVPEARMYAPAIGPVLTKVKSVKRSQATLEVTTVKRQRASLRERAVAPRTGVFSNIGLSWVMTNFPAPNSLPSHSSLVWILLE